MRPNVLMVVLDAARRDALEPYGAEPGSSPAIAQLAGRGTAHQNVHATAPWTVPSHASMFTGLMPRAASLSRVNSPADVAEPVARHRARMLPEVMRNAGYATAAASANLWLSRPTGFHAGFDEFLEIDTNRNAKLHLDSPRAKLHWYAEAVMARADDGARQVEEAIRSWAGDSERRPFFWFVNLLECHSPYLPPRPYGGWAPISRLKAAADARRHYTLTGFWRACSGVDEVPEDVLERGRRFYAASIRYMDDWLARVLEGLDLQGVLDETLVVVLSDHGENFGEDGLIGHGLSLDERLIHVPFVAAGPGAERLELTSLVDLPRGLARSVDIDGHPWSESGVPDDIAIAQFDSPVVAGDHENESKLRAMGIDGAALDLFVTPLTCATDGRLKLLKRGQETLFLDLERDPQELSPLRRDALESGRLKEFERLERAIDFGSGPVAEISADGPPASSEEIADLENRMKLLGYM